MTLRIARSPSMATHDIVQIFLIDNHILLPNVPGVGHIATILSYFLSRPCLRKSASVSMQLARPSENSILSHSRGVQYRAFQMTATSVSGSSNASSTTYLVLTLFAVALGQCLVCVFLYSSYRSNLGQTKIIFKHCYNDW